VVLGEKGSLLAQVFGITPNASSEQIQRVYNKKKLDARGNEQALQEIEDAHSRIMMLQLSSRLKVWTTVKGQ
jgi:hypothetical protein